VATQVLAKSFDLYRTAAFRPGFVKPAAAIGVIHGIAIDLNFPVPAD
jgi:hypothetical protein